MTLHTEAGTEKKQAMLQGALRGTDGVRRLCLLRAWLAKGTPGVLHSSLRFYLD